MRTYTSWKSVPNHTRHELFDEIRSICKGQPDDFYETLVFTAYKNRATYLKQLDKAGKRRRVAEDEMEHYLYGGDNEDDGEPRRKRQRVADTDDDDKGTDKSDDQSPSQLMSDDDELDDI